MSSKLREDKLFDGNEWLMGYFHPKPKQKKDVTNIDSIYMSDGVSQGAHKKDYRTVGWLKAIVPGNVRTVLLENGIIEDPYWGRQCDHSRWVEDYEWWFRREFVVAKEWRNRTLRLFLNGVDYSATYWLNGKKLGTSKDMFIPVVFDVTEIIDIGQKNVLVVRIDPPPKSSSNHFWNGVIPARAHHHRSQVSWGWDWSRHMVPMGLWDSVKLVSTGEIFVEDVKVQSKTTGTNKAKIDIEMILVNNGKNREAELVLDIKGKNFKSKLITKTQKINLKKGAQKVNVITEIEDPVLWWPNGYGRPNLYCLGVKVISSGMIQDEKADSFGIRKIKMIKNTGSPAKAYNLTFNINGRKIFAQGANWAPSDLLFGRVRKARYERLIKMAKEANFNCLRVWGGGLIEKQDFYDLCDENGIMVWQEFPLACANYPKNDKFVAEKKIEAEAIIRKLRNHPCIALWCGGNELFYYGETSASPVLKMFKKMVNKMHADIDYHYSSPDKERPGERDHGPWAYETHEFWNNHFRAFASELGCNAPLSIESIKKCIPGEELWPPGQSYNYHFMDIKHAYAINDFKPGSLEEHVQAAQFVQADQIKYIMESYRRKKWKSSGCLYWGYNDSWPHGSYGMVDYYTVPKMSYYWLKNACEPVHICVKDKDQQLNPGADTSFEVWVVNNCREKIENCLVEYKLITTDGRVLKEGSKKISVPADKPLLVQKLKYTVPEELKGLVFLNTVLSRKKKKISSNMNLYVCGSFADHIWNLPEAFVETKIRRNGNNFLVNVYNKSSRVVCGLRLSLVGEEDRTCYSDNYLFLMPGESGQVKIVRADQAHGKGRISLTGWNLKKKNFVLTNL